MLRRLNQRQSKLLLALLATILVGVAAFIHFKRPTTSPSSGKGLQPATSQDTATPDASKNSAGSSTKSTTPTSTTAQGTTPASTMPAPSGTLLNKHSVSLSATDGGSTGPDINSTCQSIAGATCDIRLTGPSGQVVMVGSKPVQESGALYVASFEWNARTLGLSVGRWKVEAVATKDGQSATSKPDYLEVSS